MYEKQKRKEKPKQKRKRKSKQKVDVSSPIMIVAGMIFAVVILSLSMTIFLVFADGDSDFDLTSRAIQATNNDTRTLIAGSATQSSINATETIEAMLRPTENPILQTATALQNSFDNIPTPDQ